MKRKIIPLLALACIAGLAVKFNVISINPKDIVLRQSTTSINPMREAIPSINCPIRTRFKQHTLLKTSIPLPNQNNAFIYNVAVSPDGSMFATVEHNEAVLWNTNTIMNITSQDDNDLDSMVSMAYPAQILLLAFSPDSTMLAAASNATIFLSNALTHHLLMVFPTNHAISAIAFSPVGATIAAAFGQNITIWNTHTFGHVATIPNSSNITALAFSPDGSKIAFVGTDSIIRIWNNSSYTPIVRDRPYPNEQITALAFSPDNALLAAGSDESAVYLLDAQTLALKNSITHEIQGDLPNTVVKIAFSQDGTKIATVEADGRARIWHTSTQKSIGPPLTEYEDFNDVSFFPNYTNKIITTGRNARIWDLEAIAFFDTLNIDQCELLQAIDMAMQQIGRIQANKQQWATFQSFPESIKHALRMYIKQPEKQVAKQRLAEWDEQAEKRKGASSSTADTSRKKRRK